MYPRYFKYTASELYIVVRFIAIDRGNVVDCSGYPYRVSSEIQLWTPHTESIWKDLGSLVYDMGI